VSFNFEIFDPAGCEYPQRLHYQYYQPLWSRVHSFVIVYGITNRKTFDELDFYLKFARRVFKQNRGCIVLCGNKCDLEDQRQVTKEEGQKLADKHGFLF